MNIEQTILRIKNAGITVDALLVESETIVVNGIDNEPLIQSQNILIKNHAEAILKGLKIVMEITKAKLAILKINSENKKYLTQFLPKDESIKLQLTENNYSVGTRQINISELYNIFYAVSGKPVTHKIVTISGEVNKSIIVNVPIGTSYNDLLKMAEGTTTQSFSVIDGSLMTGKIIENLADGITKNSSGVMVLPNDHFIVVNRKRSPSHLRTISSSVCEVLASEVMMISPKKDNILPMDMLKMKFGILKYDEVEPIYIGNKNVNRVRIKTKDPRSKVNLGQLVQMSEVIALGFHASIDGKITDINDSVIEITNEGYAV